MLWEGSGSEHLKHARPSVGKLIAERIRNIVNDCVFPKLLKSLDTSISLPLSILANASMQTGIVPNTLKIANVVPMYRSKKHDEFTNYRPMALLSSLPKVLDKLVHHRLYTFMEIIIS